MFNCFYLGVVKYLLKRCKDYNMMGDTKNNEYASQHYKHSFFVFKLIIRSPTQNTITNLIVYLSEIFTDGYERQFSYKN